MPKVIIPDESVGPDYADFKLSLCDKGYFEL